MNHPNPCRIRAPPIGELACRIDETRRRKGAACAVILPFEGGLEYVRAHLGALESQDDQEFDVILLSSSPQAAIRDRASSRAFGTVLITLNGPLGAGAFYVGQKYAFEKGYPIIILADADALPIQPDLVGRLKAAASSERLAIHLPAASSKTGDRHSPSIHWYGAMHSDALAKSGFTFLPLFFGGVDDELESRMLDSGIATRHLPDVSVSHPLFKPMALGTATARAMNDIRNRAPQFYCPSPGLWPLMPIFSAFSMLSFCDSLGRWKMRLSLARRALSSALRGHESPYFAVSDAAIPPYPACPLDDAFSNEGGAKAFSLCPEIGQSGSWRFEDACAGRGIPRSRVLFGDGGNPIGYSLALLSGPIPSGTAIVFSDWRLLFNPILLLYRRAYLHDGTSTWLVSDTASPWKRVAKFLLASASFGLLAAAYIPVSLISWLRAGKSRLRYGLG